MKITSWKQEDVTTLKSDTPKPHLAITLGDPLGIGSEIVKKCLSDPKIKKLAHWKIFGTQAQKISPRQAGLYSALALKQAMKSVLQKECDGLVTAPVSKTHLHQAGFPYPGQTEFIASHFKNNKARMMIWSPKLSIVLTTIHLPLKKIFSMLKPALIFETMVITHQALKKDFGIKNPHIAVCGLNPHAGENGLLGSEDQKIIAPAIKKARQFKMNVDGPYPADTIFYQAVKKKFDVVVCLYHDQGLIPVKTLSFDCGVNLTLGLPIIRTSPDHGCAFDIAGKGIANPSSMKEAMKLAVKIWKNRNH